MLAVGYISEVKGQWVEIDTLQQEIEQNCPVTCGDNAVIEISGEYGSIIDATRINLIKISDSAAFTSGTSSIQLSYLPEQKGAAAGDKLMVDPGGADEEIHTIQEVNGQTITISDTFSVNGNYNFYIYPSKTRRVF